MSLVLGVDPGTACGWALVHGEQVVSAGVWDLAPRRHEGGGMRYLRAQRYLDEVLRGYSVAAVGYEEVNRHRGVAAAHVYGGIVAQIGSVCESRGVPYRGMPVATVKRAATGRGNADKDAMVEAYRTATGRQAVSDDEADAYWVARALAVELGL